MKLYLVPRNLTKDPINKQGQIGIFQKQEDDIITLKFADGQIGKYFEDAVNEVEDDCYNPEFLFQTEMGFLLSLIAQGKIDAKEAAKKELARRGLDEKLNFIG
ncbi:hypothetical protein [Mesonia aestuariivivens]|uniref:Uncharacterized protein n=1 Tax=Mesonia aestuariivivens TaxID=2796128 RepID=A0ABS6W5A2_9FLAO|nr:hypothetical protein [Mesonia aestuariivivens]MBW2962308.1 hypothetical protein [Mesonia aestuariivivens]